MTELCPAYGPFLGLAGVSVAMVFSAAGSAYGCAKAGVGIAGIGQFRPDMVMKSLIPVVMSGIIGVYGLVVGVLIASSLDSSDKYPLFNGFLHLGSGLAVGFTGLAGGYAIGIVGDYGIRSYYQRQQIFVAVVLILIFAEVLSLYGLIVSLILNTKTSSTC